MLDEPRLYAALPVMNEWSNIDKLISCLSLQTYRNFELVVCVNQYDSWWKDNNQKNICIDNQHSLEYLKTTEELEVIVIDKTSEGNGWLPKKGGVGWARKIIMDHISVTGNSTDIIVSIDADTYYPPEYLQSIVSFFNNNNKLLGLALPYYHRLADDETDRLILRYEIYMRYYLLNMFRINNPYSFTALGSAMAFPVWAYQKVGGLTPVAAGEDFYFLQKLMKSGNVGIWCETIAFPSPRFSNRVAFGTGPALIKGNTGNWSSYPHYKVESFDKIQDTYQLFDRLYMENIETPMDEFIIEFIGQENIWEPLRRNYKDRLNFKKACINKIDGLRILQFLRREHENDKQADEVNLYNFLINYHRDNLNGELIQKLHNFDYKDSELITLIEIRELLTNIEMKIRKSRHIANTYHYG